MRKFYSWFRNTKKPPNLRLRVEKILIDIYEYWLPEGFIPIGGWLGGNVICLGTKEPYYEAIYFWDHEQESENPDDMNNVYFLAANIDEFVDNLFYKEWAFL